MPKCPKCGVEVEPNRTHCPLCNEEVVPSEDDVLEQKEEYIPKYPPEEENEAKTKEQSTPKTKTRIIWEITGVVLLIPLITSISIDLIVSPQLDWALYPVASLVLVWLMVTPLLLFPKRIFISAPTIIVSLLVYFLVLDLIDNGQINWYLQIPLPIILLISAVTLVIVLITLKIKNKGLNIVGAVLIGAGIICLGIDFAVTSYVYSIYSLKWSLYVLVPATLVGAFLFYVHYRIMKRIDIKRKFHS